MKRLFLLVSITVVVVLGWGSAPAGAATPAVRGCYGNSISALATALPPGAFGAATRDFAQLTPEQGSIRPGLGDGVQLVQAGLVADEIVPNTCNG